MTYAHILFTVNILCRLLRVLNLLVNGAGVGSSVRCPLWAVVRKSVRRSLFFEQAFQKWFIDIVRKSTKDMILSKCSSLFSLLYADALLGKRQKQI